MDVLKQGSVPVRGRWLKQANDVAYFHSMASSPATGTSASKQPIPVCQVNVTPRS